MDNLRVRLNCIDHYQAVPTEFDPRVPYGQGVTTEKHRLSVIRVFGATDTGQKVLMHIHGALQYTYIEYAGSLMTHDVSLAIQTLWSATDHALATSYRKNPYDPQNKYVAHISLVKGVPFYGFHVGYQFYFKIYLLNPLHMTRLADLLRDGAILKRVLHPYESHLQYLAQWMCDYNLYGCAYIECAAVKFRGPVPKYDEMRSLLHRWHDYSIHPDMISDPAVLPKQSHCTLEVDVCVHDILNRHGIKPRALHHDFVERLHPLPLDVKLVQSMEGLWEDETRRRKARMGLRDMHSTPFPPEVLISMSADPRNTDSAGWMHEEEFRAKVAQIAMQERAEMGRSQVTFGDFVHRSPFEQNVQTALESVEELYPLHKRMANWSTRKQDGIGSDFVSTPSTDEHLRTDEDDSFSRLFPLPETQEHSSHSNMSASPTSTTSTVRSSIASQEYTKLGVRRTDGSTRIDEDDFDTPSEDASSTTSSVDRDIDDSVASSGTKRGASGSPAETHPKRLRLTSKAQADELADPEDLSHSDYYGKSTEQINEGLEGIPEFLTPEPFPFPSAQPSPGAHQSTLSFSVVKNPNDPMTLLRLSQQSSSAGAPSPQLHPTKISPGQPLKSSSTEISFATEVGSDSPSTFASSGSQPIPSLNFDSIMDTSQGSKLLMYHQMPPSRSEMMQTMSQLGLPDVIYQGAYYSREKDVPIRSREYAGKEFKLQSNTIPYLPDFDATGQSPATFGKNRPVIIDRAAEKVKDRQRRQRCTIKEWSIAAVPPRKSDVIDWLSREEKGRQSTSRKLQNVASSMSQIDVVTQTEKLAFKYGSRQSTTSVQHEIQYMSMMSLEVHVNTRGSLAPNPDHDPISCIFWCIQSDDADIKGNCAKEGAHLGVLAVATSQDTAKKIRQIVDIDVEQETTELNLLNRMVDIVRSFDPDILTGYEVHNSSWGYLIERARKKYDMNFCDQVSRMKSQSHGRFGKEEDRWGFNQTSTVRVTGRHTINIWRAMRGELNLLQYTMENVVDHLLHRRIPHYSFPDLTKWYQGTSAHHFARVVEYFLSRVQLDLEILEANELIPRTSEQARLLGVDWFSVISRGSQFKVESLMFRIAKPENFMLISPSRRQVGGQNALECLPLVMEPQSDFYTSPVLVLDFQSLYPSVMIAYNYCYSTFLGRIVGWRGTNKMGFTDYHRSPGLIELLKDSINVAPNGIMYAKPEIRKSLLAKMLSEILETRVMVKSGMKADKDDHILQVLLNSRQLALKLIANVTYGYTSASFSGRMPCSEIADSIVQTGRETLEKAIGLIHSIEKWGGEVVYGDTDSIFVHLKGRTKEQAFDIGEEIAKAVTDTNPRPIKLKFEKVYHPCVLIAKKRYVGYKWESRTQTEPEFEAKGIETVRRDGTPAEQKIEESALKILFSTADLSQVKSYFRKQCFKIMKGSVSVQDFCFAKEVKLGTYSEKRPPPPGALISTRRMMQDPRMEPQYGERVPYVVVTGGPRARLIDRCVGPEILLHNSQMALDAEYYISKNIIPPLERIFNLVGANVRQWYDEMPKIRRARRVGNVKAGTGQRTLEFYMKPSSCAICRRKNVHTKSNSGLCRRCIKQAPRSILHIHRILAKSQRKVNSTTSTCRSCSGLGWNEEIRCDSKDCPTFYSRIRYSTTLSDDLEQYLPILKTLEDSMTW